MPSLELVTLVVRDYDSAIRFFVDVLGFELVEDTPSLTNDGRPKRWVVVRPVGGQTGLLLARADGDLRVSVVGQQFGGRVGLLLRVDDFEGLLRTHDQSRCALRLGASHRSVRQSDGVHRPRGKSLGSTWPRSPSTGGWLSLHIAPSRAHAAVD